MHVKDLRNMKTKNLEEFACLSSVGLCPECHSFGRVGPKCKCLDGSNFISKIYFTFLPRHEWPNKLGKKHRTAGHEEPCVNPKWLGPAPTYVNSSESKTKWHVVQWHHGRHLVTTAIDVVTPVAISRVGEFLIWLACENSWVLRQKVVGLLYVCA